MPSIPPAPTGRAGLLIAALSTLATPAWAIDWDGDFPNTGNYNGKVDDPANWDFNFLPDPTTGVTFNANDTYTVAFNVDFETAGMDLTAGDVTFESLSGIQDFTYSINGFTTIEAMLTLDGVNLASGSTFALALQIENGGSLYAVNAGQSIIGSIRVGDYSSTDGTLTLDGVEFETTSGGNLIGGGGTGALMTLVNGAIFNASASNFLIGRPTTTTGTVQVLGGSDLHVGGILGLADGGLGSGTAILEVSGGGSRLYAQASSTTNIGNDASGSARLTVMNDGTADLYGSVEVFATGTLENLGGTINILGPATVGGAFTQTSGETNFVGTTGFDAAASFSHTGGLIRFRDDTTIAIQDIDFGSPTEPNEATWDIGSEVVYNRRLRVGSSESSYSLIEVADNGGTQGILRNTGTGGQADLTIGYAGTGELRISDLGEVDIYDDVVIGQLANGVGKVFVTGIGSADINQRSVLRVNRNGSGSNLFVGLDGDGLLAVAGGGLVEVGNDLVVQATDTAGITSLLNVGVDPSLALESSDTVIVGNDLLIGNIGGMGGTSSGLVWLDDTAFVSVQGHTHVRQTGELLAARGSVLVTNMLTTESTSEFEIDGGAVRVFSGNATLNHGDLVINGDASVPNQGARGSFELYSGANAVVDGNVVIGDGAGTSGRLTLDGAGTTFGQVPGLYDAFVGDGGDGQVLVTGGASIDIRRAVNIATTLGSTGRVSISGVAGGGDRSSLTVTGLGDSSAIRVGAGSSTSDLVISDGAFVQTSGGVSIGNASVPGPGSHTVTIGGASGGFSAELMARNLTINGGTTSTLQINEGGLVVLQPNSPITTVFLINGAGAALEMTGGEFYTPRFTRGSGGAVLWTGGTIYVDEVTGSLTNNGGTLSPGSSQFSPYSGVEFSSDYTQTSAGTTRIEIGGTLRGIFYDYVDVDGTLSLGGTLEVVVLGAAPTLGDSYDLLDWGTLVGTFDTLDLPGVGNGNTWGLDNLYTTGVIEVIRSGDLDSDGSVGVADLDIILAHWGQSVTPFDETMGDASGDGFVDNDDLQIVLDQFGDTTYPGASSIPEPATATLLLLTLAGLRRRR